MNHQHTIVYQTYSSIAEATIILNKLEANGIKAFLKDENVLGLDPVAGVELRIFEDDMVSAKSILAPDQL